MKSHKQIIGLLSVLAVVLLLTGCGGGTTPNASDPGVGPTADTSGSVSAGDPTVDAKAFLDSLYTGGAVDTMICTTDTAMATTLRASMEQMRDSLTSTGATIDTSGLTYTAANQTADTADVTVNGNLRVTAGGATTDTPFPATTIRMRNEGGMWKVCG